MSETSTSHPKKQKHHHAGHTLHLIGRQADGKTIFLASLKYYSRQILSGILEDDNEELENVIKTINVNQWPIRTSANQTEYFAYSYPGIPELGILKAVSYPGEDITSGHNADALVDQISKEYADGDIIGIVINPWRRNVKAANSAVISLMIHFQTSFQMNLVDAFQSAIRSLFDVKSLTLHNNDIDRLQNELKILEKSDAKKIKLTDNTSGHWGFEEGTEDVNDVANAIMAMLGKIIGDTNHDYEVLRAVIHKLEKTPKSLHFVVIFSHMDLVDFGKIKGFNQDDLTNIYTEFIGIGNEQLASKTRNRIIDLPFIDIRDNKDADPKKDEKPLVPARFSRSGAESLISKINTIILEEKLKEKKTDTFNNVLRDGLFSAGIAAFWMFFITFFVACNCSDLVKNNAILVSLIVVVITFIVSCGFNGLLKEFFGRRNPRDQ